jgi:hypothetical protein
LNIEIIGNQYVNGKRVSSQKVTYDKSDDLFTLANLNKQYESICEQIDNSAEGADISYMKRDRDAILAKIKEQQAIVDGYNG